MLPAALFAATDATDPTLFLGLLMGGLFVLLTAADKIDAILTRRRRSPSLDEALALKADRTEIAQLEQKLRAEQNAALRDIVAMIEASSRERRDQIEKINHTLNTELRDIARDIGELKGAQNG